MKIASLENRARMQGTRLKSAAGQRGIFFKRFDKLEGLPRYRGSPGRKASDFGSGYAIARNRKVTICARVQVVSGLKLTALTPLVICCSTAHATALA